ncbi:transposase family protein [Dactylosporangium sp. NPDC000244]|uniref:transposase family protein n=1 Tax=Dactylosporangium sp. NPDC000244 TaxID=3154365 RepID=UPI00331EA19F
MLAGASVIKLAVVVTAAVCAVVAGNRSYTAIGEWVADLPADTAVLLGIDADRRPSEAMIRRRLQALDPRSARRRGREMARHTDSRTSARIPASDRRGQQDPAWLTQP